MLDTSAEVLRAGLTGLAERQKLIANNLANVETPGYRAQDVSFENVLYRQLQGASSIPLATSSPGHMVATAAGGSLYAPITASQPGVDVDAEMARLSETVIEYNAVAQLMTARFSLLRSAVTEGRR